MAEEDRMEGTDYQLRSARDHRASGILGKGCATDLYPQASDGCSWLLWK